MFYIFIHLKLKWIGHKLSKLMRPSPYTVTIAEYQYRLSLILTKMTFTVLKYCSLGLGVRVMVLNATFSNISVISWQSVLLVEETGVPRENH